MVLVNHASFQQTQDVLVLLLEIFVGLATFSATKFVFGAALRLGIFQVIRGGRAPHHFHHRY